MDKVEQSVKKAIRSFGLSKRVNLEVDLSLDFDSARLFILWPKTVTGSTTTAYALAQYPDDEREDHNGVERYIPEHFAVAKITGKYYAATREDPPDTDFSYEVEESTSSTHFVGPLSTVIGQTISQVMVEEFAATLPQSPEPGDDDDV